MPTAPESLRADLDAAADFLRPPGDLLITSHVNSDGDGIASGLALAGLMRQLGHTPDIVLQDVATNDYSFLAGWQSIAAAGARAHVYGRAVVLDCPNLERIGNTAARLAPGARLLNIDHHRDNGRFATVNLATNDVCSTCEAIYHLAVYMGLAIDRDIAEQLYTGILFDTGGFRYSLTTATSLEVGADLVRRGARLDHLADRLYNNDTFDDVKIIGRAIDSLELHCQDRLAVMWLTHEDMQRGDPEATVNFGLRVRGVAVSILLKEERVDHYRVSLRSREGVDVGAVATGFGGGGHARAAGCRLDGDFGSVRQRLIDAIVAVLP